MQSVAQGWLVRLLTNSPFYVGLVSALGSLGVLLFTLYAGVIADRTDKRRTVVITQTLQMLQGLRIALGVAGGLAAQRGQHLGGELPRLHERLHDRLAPRVERAIGIVLPEFPQNGWE